MVHSFVVAKGRIIASGALQAQEALGASGLTSPWALLEFAFNETQNRCVIEGMRG